MINLESKSILFISPTFFGYEQSIQKRLEELGGVVDYFDERPANSFWVKAFIRINPRFLSYIIKKYYKKIENKIQDKSYDYIFVLNIEAMPASFLNYIRKRNPTAKFILYMWDSIFNKKNTLHYISFFDKVFSFDANDCKQIPTIRFRPLFYLNEYKQIADYTDFEYDFSFIGTAHSDRYYLIRTLQKQIENKGMRGYWFLYLQSRKLFLFNKINNPAFKGASLKDFNYKSLPKQLLLDKIKKSKVVLDIQHPKQSGLTMRTIEMLGAKRKLVTTNSMIRTYDFYSPDNILVIDRNNPVIPNEFFNTTYLSLPDPVYYKYSLDGWLEDILY